MGMQHLISIHTCNCNSWSDVKWSFVPSVRCKEYWFSRSVKQYICLQTTQWKVPQPRVGQYHFKHLSVVDDINHFKTHLLHTHESLRVAQLHNTNHVFTYILKLRCCSHPGHRTHSGRNPVIHVLIRASTSHYNSNVLHQITCDTQTLYGHESTVCSLYMKTERHYCPTDSHVQQNF